MTFIKNIQISNFKGIESLEIDLGMLNIITGENNAGKTSVLQAIDIAFNPRKITNYGDSVNYLINSHSDTAEVNIKYIQTAQTSLQEFTDQDPADSRVEERSLKITVPTKTEAVQLLVDAIIGVTETSPNANYLVDRFSRRRLELDVEDEDPNDVVQNAVRNAIAGIPEERLSQWAEDSVVIITIDGKKYPYVYLDGFYSECKTEIVDAASKEVIDKLGREEQPLIEDESNDVENAIVGALNDLLVPRFGRGRFINEKPPEIDGVKFVAKSIQLSSDDVDPDKENAAVRLSDIGDYLRENQLVEDLDTLSTEQIVYDDGQGDKYQVPYEFMGDGFKAMVGVLWELSSAKRRSNVLLLEEAENHMHPEYINQLSYHLVDIIENKDIQVFITTHNIDLIRSFFNVTEKRMERFLIKEFNLLKMDSYLPDEYGYTEAKDHATQLQLDLR